MIDLHSLNNHGKGALWIICAVFFSNSPEIAYEISTFEVDFDKKIFKVIPIFT